MLTTVEIVQRIQGLGNLASIPIAWLNDLVGAADTSIKRYCKRDLEMQSYVEMYSGDNMQDLVLRQYPVFSAQTTITSSSSGQVLPQATINVVSTANFPSGTGTNPGAVAPTLNIQTGLTSWTTVTYTGTTATSFTGCLGGTGTLSSATNQNGVGMPAVFLDSSAYWGQAPTAFQSNSQLVQGVMFAAIMDGGDFAINRNKSARGLLRRIGGGGAGFFGFYPEQWGMYSGKLGATRRPVWQRGDGNIKVMYTAGYEPNKVPFDLQYVASLLVAQMIRTQPTGANMASESLGQYSYNILMSPDNPEMGDARRILAYYRESSWGL